MVRGTVLHKLAHFKKKLSVHSQKEFGSEPENAADMDLASLAARYPAYVKPGAYMSSMITKMISAKMPGGFGPAAVRSYLTARFHVADRYSINRLNVIVIKCTEVFHIIYHILC